MITIAFAAGDEFAKPALQALATEDNFDLNLVLATPDRAAGRGMKTKPGPIPAAAKKQGLHCRQPMVEEELLELLRDSTPEFLVTCAYGRKLSPEALAVASKASINIHASLLPRWRGAAPIERALLAGDTETGVTTMLMAERIDAGAVLQKKSVPITPTSTSGELREQLALIGASLIKDTLLGFDEITPEVQDPSLATKAPRIAKEEAELIWNNDAAGVDRQIRAFNPRPGAFTLLAGERTKIFSARIESACGEAGKVIDLRGDGPLIACGSGSLLLTQLQPAGGKRLSGAAWLNGRGGKVAIGDSA